MNACGDTIITYRNPLFGDWLLTSLREWFHNNLPIACNLGSSHSLHVKRKKLTAGERHIYLSPPPLRKMWQGEGSDST